MVAQTKYAVDDKDNKEIQIMTVLENLDTIERVLTLPVPVEKAWSAISTPEGLSSWFSDRATFEPAVGADMRLEWNEYDSVPARVETYSPTAEFAFRWIAFGGRDTEQMTSLNSTLITFTLKPITDGTEITMCESGFASLAPELHGVSRPEHVSGWNVELQELEDYLTGAI